MRSGGIIEVPQIWLSLRPPIFNSQIHTDIFSETYAGWGNEWVTLSSQITQIVSTYPQMRPIRADDAVFFLRTYAVPLIGVCLDGCEGGV